MFNFLSDPAPVGAKAPISSPLPLLYLFHFGSVSKGKGHFIFHLVVSRQMKLCTGIHSLGCDGWSLDSFHGELTAGLIGTLLFYVASKTFSHLKVG